jgi:plasmid stabilization system protein ParE
MRVIWKQQAERDLLAIEEYYLQVAPEFGDFLVTEIFRRTNFLSESPLVGRKVPEINDPTIRELIYRNYRIVYHTDLEESRIEILTVFHSSREFG